MTGHNGGAQQAAQLLQETALLLDLEFVDLMSQQAKQFGTGLRQASIQQTGGKHHRVFAGIKAQGGLEILQIWSLRLRFAMGKPDFNRTPGITAKIPHDIERHGHGPFSHHVVTRNIGMIDLILKRCQT